MNLPVIVINGPTASGKTSAAVGVAKSLIAGGWPSEVVNADSMLVYRGMDIGTAKPTLAQRDGVIHHLIDIFDITQTASVSEFQAMARTAISDCRIRGVIPIVAGGSALYMRAILDVFDFPATDPKVRAKWEARCREIGPHALHKELAALSAKTADGILPGNARRIIRALEVIELTGSFKSSLPEWTYVLDNIVQFGLTIDRDQLDQRIRDRVGQMWAAGFVAEVSHLETAGLRRGLTAARGLGYQQILSYLAGEISEDEAKSATISGTRRFARKQLSWFKRDHRIHWIAAGETAVGQIMALVTESLPKLGRAPFKPAIDETETVNDTGA